ncbi:isocitrate/isopropylmalate dehydrogenase family protein [Methanoplanus sp. FWC-SCC4]|uniref:Isocitrate/isopropylmalate dehydrogenase family protein n=1 Tax=Methanochimaera problematica TaxID=2609417 RepID=A0AA97I2X3_9EURY|nr:isocitrate/isopropylmalate dehydrogenase family protein [Methanoplanus sp. FWC-SCC4]WOF15281.1 isocitrate/isopropylmalate dehydrogenase family protein [Methanoplanus sp. FWC-SCC4]
MKIAIVKGDGIGQEVIPPAEKILRHFLPGAEYFDVKVGYEKWKETGTACTDDDIKKLKSADAILFGAITTPPDPDYKSVIMKIRHELDLYANLRPVKGDGFDIMVVRENTEGLYSGIEEIGEERSTTLRVITRKGSERIAKAACELAIKRGSTKPVVIGNKANVLKSDVLFRDTCIGVCKSYGLEYKTMFIDALTLDVLMQPSNYDVIVTTNIFGDILSDACGYLTGGLGMLPSANIGDAHAFFEPVHGSAPDIAGKNIANPIAAIRSAGMLLDHFGYCEYAALVEKAISASVSMGVCTKDLGGNYGTKETGEYILTEIIKEEKSD